MVSREPELRTDGLQLPASVPAEAEGDSNEVLELQLQAYALQQVSRKQEVPHVIVVLCSIADFDSQIYAGSYGNRGHVPLGDLYC